jgi:type I restriction enzyme, R subunit
MAFLSEDALEQALLAQLSELGYAVLHSDAIAPDSPKSERESYADVVLKGRFAAALARLNPHLPASALADAQRQLLHGGLPALLLENKRIHQLLVEGVDVEYYAADGTLTAGKAALIDFARPERNDWLAVNQFVVMARHSGQSYNRRPDVVLFVNGLPLVVVELKAPGSEAATLAGAYNQLQTYKAQIPALFHCNALLVTSDGLAARVGSLSADLERFMPWRIATGGVVLPKGLPELPTLVEGVLAKPHLLMLLHRFTVFRSDKSGLNKVVAGYHQMHAVLKAVESTLRASAEGISLQANPQDYGLPSVRTQPRGDKRAGVIWHTQGSGKSLLMAFYAGYLVQEPCMANPTVVVLTDRNDLDEQLFTTFSQCADLLRQTPVQAQNRDDLQRLLNRASGGVIFTTIQKFGETAQALTLRRNVVVMVDEAHRSQYGFSAKMDGGTGAVSYGFAKYLRDALPNASFIGFTGTPIEATDVNTPAIFGNYIDVYDISRAVEDGATVPIYYESRLARLELNEAEKPLIDAEIEGMIEDSPEAERERAKQKWATVEALVGSEKRLNLVATDLVQHFENRLVGTDGKAMVVCMSRRICVALYDAIVQLRPDWHSADDALGAVKIVMTGAASDPPEWQPHIGAASRREALALRARAFNDPLKLVIVCDMWLTGFDAPSMHTMYLDKPMRGHGLMQAIARVNRVFAGKSAGLIVDYIGVAQNLKSALQQYSKRDQNDTGINAAQAIAMLLEKYAIVRDMFHGFDYRSALAAAPHARLVMMAGAIEWVLSAQHQAAAQEASAEGKKTAHRRYADAVLALSRAYALASASDEAVVMREEVGFFQAIRAALVKSDDVGAGAGLSSQDRAKAIQQIVSRAVVSTHIVDILQAAGLQSHDVSVLSDEFLQEVQGLKHKNLALEALKQLLNDSIRSQNRSNVVQSRAFSDRLADAVARYHANAITTAEMLQELVDIAKGFRAAMQRGEDLGLSAEEIAFYDALAENDSAKQAMTDATLRVIAQELIAAMRQNVTVDWMHRENARAHIRRTVKRILRKYGYPPDLQNAAVMSVLKQAEALAHLWNT